MLILDTSHHYLIIQHLPKEQEVAILNLSHVTTAVEGSMIHSMTEHSSRGWATLFICTTLKMGIVEKFEIENLTIQSNGWDKVVQCSISRC